MSILLFGDCITELKDIDSDSIDLIYADLPYATKTFGTCTSCEWDKPIDLEQLWIELMRVKKLNTPIFMSCNVKLGYELIRTCPKKCPFRYDLIWIKGKLDGVISKTGFLSSKKMPLRSHELVYVFYEKLPFYDLSSHKHKFIKERDTKQKHGKIYEGEGNKKIMEGKYEPKLPDTLLEIKVTRGKHSTEKPVALMEWILKYYSKEGDVILDPTMGSGSTGVACRNMNRNFIGIELNPEYYEIAVDRIEE